MTPSLSPSLTVTDTVELALLEDTIRKGIQASIEMAQALMTIRERQLYRDCYSSFEEYCQCKWGFTDRYARLLLNFATTVGHLVAGGSTDPVLLPEREWQARPLNNLKTPEAKQEAWTGACAIAQGIHPTNNEVRRAVRASQLKRNSPAIGDRLRVGDSASPFYDQEVEVVGVDGVILHAKVSGGSVVPILSSEINPPVAAPTRKPSRPSNPLEAVELKLETERLRCQELEQVLTELCNLILASPRQPWKKITTTAQAASKLVDCG